MHTASSPVKSDTPKGAETDGDAYERFSPETERVLRSIESGTYVAKTYTPDEFLEYLKRIWEE